MKTFQEITDMVALVPMPPRLGRSGVLPRPWQQLFWSHVKEENGHWIWTACEKVQLRTGSDVKYKMKSPRHVAAELAGAQVISITRASCGESRCVNPEHLEGVTKELRDAEILRKWKNHLDNYTSMPLLAEEFGMTRQRIQQIVKRAGMPYKNLKEEIKK